MERPLQKGRIVAGKYQVLRKLKTGGFGSVYIGRGIGQDSTRYAIKLMPKKYERYANVEYEIYELIKNKKFTLGFIKQFDYGVVEQEIFLVMELIGYDLEEIMGRMKNKHFSLKTVLMIGLQTIDRIEALHTIGYVHRDIKPDNLAIGTKERDNVIYLLDFGLVIRNSDPVPSDQKGKMIGTLGFMSLKCHEGKKAEYLDDIESFVYSLVYMAVGVLPWMHIDVKTVADYHRIRIMKQKMNRDWFTRSKLPTQLYDILQIARSRDSKNKIDYLNIKYKLLSALSQIKQENDFDFDWCGVLDVTHDKEDSPEKRVQERKKINEMNKSNQKIVQNQIYQVYKFIDSEKLKQDPSNSKLKGKSPKARNKNQVPVQKNQRKIESSHKKERVTSRPMSVKNPRTQKAKVLNAVQKRLQQIGPISYEGPRIVINRTAQHKI